MTPSFVFLASLSSKPQRYWLVHWALIRQELSFKSFGQTIGCVAALCCRPSTFRPRGAGRLVRGCSEEGSSSSRRPSGWKVLISCYSRGPTEPGGEQSCLMELSPWWTESKESSPPTLRLQCFTASKTKFLLWIFHSMSLPKPVQQRSTPFFYH